MDVDGEEFKAGVQHVHSEVGFREEMAICETA